MPQLTLGDAIELCRLLAETADARFPRPAARWLERLAAETGATLAELQPAAGALARLGEEPADLLARETLERLAEYPPSGERPIGGDTAEAMSQENVGIIRAAIDALNRGDMDAAFKAAAPGFEFDFSQAVGPQHGVYGLDEMLDFFREFRQPWGSIRFGVDEFIDAGDHVVTSMTNVHRGRDGIEVQARVTAVWTFQDGKIARLVFYPEHQEALDAAGLEE